MYHDHVEEERKIVPHDSHARLTPNSPGQHWFLWLLLLQVRSNSAEPVGMAAAEVLVPVLLSGSVVVSSCAAMAFFYVAILYSPTLVLRLPPPTSLENFMIRRFICVVISSIVSVIAASALLGSHQIRSFHDVSLAMRIFGIRWDRMLHAAAFPTLLTSLLYAGSIPKLLSLTSEWRECFHEAGCILFCYRRLLDKIQVLCTNVLAWRVYVVAPVTEELVFRACMIPLLLCGGFRKYSIIFLCPVFFSLAHLNHFLELYYQKGYSFLRASKVVGVQLVYTVIFGWYAAFLFMRTGNLLSPIVAHVVCNSMGLPAFSSSRSKVVTGVVSIAGFLGFFLLLFPATDPRLYNDTTDNCRCWHGYCNWD